MIAGCDATSNGDWSRPKQYPAVRQVEPPIRQVVDRAMDDFSEPPPFNWGEGVLMGGVMEAALALDEPKYVRFVQQWADHWNRQDIAEILEGAPDAYLKAYCGHWGPGYPLVLLYRATGNETYLDMAKQIADFILTRATRTDEGGFGHWGGNYELWSDTLYMLTPLFTELTDITGDRRYLDEAITQLDIVARRTQDPDTGLFWHMYDAPADRIVGVQWARGNGWVAMSYVAVLEYLEEDHPAYERLLDQFDRLVDGLLEVRDESACMWHTVLDDPETYLETSATAMILSSFVRAERAGFLRLDDPRIIPCTWRAIEDKVSEDGHVFDVSAGTIPDHPEVYAVKYKGTYTWGTGAFLMAASALLPDHPTSLK
jgi:unsaturated rhamnogalacturonyl hydrolase